MMPDTPPTRLTRLENQVRENTRLIADLKRCVPDMVVMTQQVESMSEKLNALVPQVTELARLSDLRLYCEVAQAQIDGRLELNATRDVTVRWTNPMPNATYAVRMAYIPSLPAFLAGQLVLDPTYQPRTTTQCTVRVRAQGAALTLGGTMFLIAACLA